MDIIKHTGLRLRSVVTHLAGGFFLAGGLLLVACEKEGAAVGAEGGNSASRPAGAATYCSLELRLGDTRGTEAPGTETERTINNVAVVFFDDTQRFETMVFFDGSQLIAEDGTGNLGSGVSAGITLRKAVSVSSGDKTVVALANCNAYLRQALNQLLEPGKTTYAQLCDYELSLLASGVRYPARLDLPKYGYKAPLPSGMLQLDRLGIGDTAVEPDGLLMAGSAAGVLATDVSQEDATVGNANLIRIQVDRLAAKASLRFSPAVTYQTLTNPASNTFATVYQPDITTPLVRAEWWIANMPAGQYLLGRTSGSLTPYYDPAPDFSMWQNQRTATTRTLDYEEHAAYMPENMVASPMRGNVSYLAVKAEFDLYNINESEEYGASALDIDGYELFLSAESDGSNDWMRRSYVPLPLGSLDVSNIIVLRDETGKRKFLTCNDGIRACLHNFFVYELSVPKPPMNVVLCDMDRNDRSKAAQDAAVVAAGDPAEAGWYGFYYDADGLQTGKWYDELIFYYYDGQTDAAGGLQRGEMRSYTVAVYRDRCCYYRIDLQDMEQPLSAAERFAVGRNDWFDVEIGRIRELGYPDPEDLASNPADAVSSSWLEVTISVQNWREGGNQSETIGDLIR